jgi:SpoVK/Ycf46/Vps4 family AAA+-type ATPase
LRVTPPRGLLLHGPPGTGKTLLARALAHECAQSIVGGKITFFARKGADLLSKFHGESESQLRLLFKKATACAPSIILFDEIDGLTPTRSAKQNQVHSSLVTTLLSCMDGIDDRGSVFVIGTTNRIDDIDSALRRPGRFDRELYVHLPSLDARQQILTIHTRSWKPIPPCIDTLITVARHTIGYCGADLRSLCVEAALVATRRTLPSSYLQSTVRHNDVIDAIPGIVVTLDDFMAAARTIVPASRRAESASSLVTLPLCLVPFITPVVDRCIKLLRHRTVSSTTSSTNGSHGSGNMSNDDGTTVSNTGVRWWNNRLMIDGRDDMGQSLVLQSLLQSPLLEGSHVQSLDLPSLLSSDHPEETIVAKFRSARSATNSVLLLPRLDEWWRLTSVTMRAALVSCLRDLPPPLSSIPHRPFLLSSPSSSSTTMNPSSLEPQSSSSSSVLVIATSHCLFDAATAYRLEIHASLLSFFNLSSVTMYSPQPTAAIAYIDHVIQPASTITPTLQSPIVASSSLSPSSERTSLITLVRKTSLHVLCRVAHQVAATAPSSSLITDASLRALIQSVSDSPSSPS